MDKELIFEKESGVAYSCKGRKIVESLDRSPPVWKCALKEECLPLYLPNSKCVTNPIRHSCFNLISRFQAYRSDQVYFFFFSTLTEPTYRF